MTDSEMVRFLMARSASYERDAKAATELREAARLVFRKSHLEDRVRCGLPARDDRPSHVTEKPGDRYSLCGLKDPLPVVAAKHAAMHVAGHGMVVCAECAAKR